MFSSGIDLRGTTDIYSCVNSRVSESAAIAQGVVLVEARKNRICGEAMARAEASIAKVEGRPKHKRDENDQKGNKSCGRNGEVAYARSSKNIASVTIWHTILTKLKGYVN